MIATNYDFDSDYHEGSLVEQDARAFLGVFKCLNDVPERHYLGNFESDIDAEEAWHEFDAQELSDLSFHTRRYVYGKGWREWKSYCNENDLHPALADPADVDDHLSAQKAEINTLKTVHDARFRPLFRWYRWMQFRTDYPHKYNPIVMAVLLDGATADIWETRLFDREYVPSGGE